MPVNTDALHAELVVYHGCQYPRGALPAGVDAEGLPTLADWFDSQRVTATAKKTKTPTEEPSPTRRKSKS